MIYFVCRFDGTRVRMETTRQLSARKTSLADDASDVLRKAADKDISREAKKLAAEK